MARSTGLDVTTRNDIALVTLDRPDAGNALDAALVAELAGALRSLERDRRARVVVVLGAGTTFCAGEDRRSKAQTDAQAFAGLFANLAALGKPTIARVHGDAIGAGVGLVACCDIAIAAHGATFRLPDATLGRIPATVAPYLIEAIGSRQARRYMMTAERFDAADAYRIGLVHDIVPTVETLDGRINELLGALLAAGPRAQAAVKALVRSLGPPIDERVVAETAKRSAEIAASEEGREGTAAMQKKRAPSWLPASLREPK